MVIIINFDNLNKYIQTLEGTLDNYIKKYWSPNGWVNISSLSFDYSVGCDSSPLVKLTIRYGADETTHGKEITLDVEYDFLNEPCYFIGLLSPKIYEEF